MIKKKRGGGRVSLGGPGEKWLERTFALFQSFETVLVSPATKTSVPPPSSRTLRERKPPSAVASPKGSPKARRTKEKVVQIDEGLSPASASSAAESVEEVQKKLEGLDLDKVGSESEGVAATAKKVQRVILRVKEPQTS